MLRDGSWVAFEQAHIFRDEEVVCLGNAHLLQRLVWNRHFVCSWRFNGDRCGAGRRGWSVVGWIDAARRL